jgi:hypothetical protein
MASPNSTFTELVTSTFRKVRKDVKDNLSNRNALLKHIYRRGNYRTEDGGLTIVTPLDYAANSTYQRYSDWDTLNIAASDVISAAEYQWRQISLSIVASGREKRINSGESKIFSLAKSKMKNAIRTFNNSFSSDMYSTGLAANQINGLQALVADLGTGTVGGINSTTFSFWQNSIFKCSTQSVTASATTIENSMLLPTWLAIDRGPDDCPDLIVMDNIYYQYFEASQTSIKRYMGADSASAGLMSLKYKGADVYYDGNSGIPSSRAYLLNTNYFDLVVHKDADLEVVEGQRPINQDGEVIPILWMGNLTLSNRKLQAVILP